MTSLKYFFFLLFPFFFVDAENNIYKAIAEENARAFDEGLVQQSGDVLNSLLSQEKMFHEIVYDKFNEQLNPSEKLKHQTVFSLLIKHEEKRPSEPSEVLDRKSWQDLELLCGSPSNPQRYLASILDRTITSLGRALFYHKIVQPCADVQKLVEQQKIVKELVNNEPFFKELDNELRQIKAFENLFLSFWSDEFFASMFKKGGFQMPFSDKINMLKRFNVWVNKNEFFAEIRNHAFDLHEIFIGSLSMIAVLVLPAVGISRIIEHPYTSKIQSLSTTLGLNTMSIYSIIGCLCYLTRFYENRYTKGMSDAVSGGVSGVGVWYATQNLKVSNALNYCWQTKLMHVSKYLRAINNILTCAQRNQFIISGIPSLRNYKETVEKLHKKSKDIDHLLKLFETQTFRKEQASSFSYLGRIIVAYRLFLEVKDEFVDLMLAAGELDMYMSIARLYKEFKNSKNSFCFPEYFTGSSPFIAMDGFWNPFLNSKSAISNAISMGGLQPRNIIVTGPNAAGKSTTIKGLMLSIILAQSLGIAPAQKLEFTPFSKIITYLNITDDISAGNSRFMAETQRARDLVEVTKKVAGTTQFSLMAADEIFNGTAYKEGEAAAYSLVEQLGGVQNNVSLMATHFSRVALLEAETGLFANYKVEVSYDAAGKIVYSYKLVRGITDQVVTFDILKEQGFGDTFLTRARDMLKK